ncbi:MAG: DUF4423 domain-containing protein [Proteobacteria bacterium]|nr:DUF4423 domain-containing protein [Pseudomonadota bacterium]
MSVFEFASYLDYLKTTLTDDGRRVGAKSALAAHLRCQPTFISQVLAARCHLSLEHAILASDFFKHSEDEREFFLLLVQLEKAGSVKLRTYFLQQLQKIKSRRAEISQRIAVRQGVRESFLPTYYSMWWYSAIHVMTAFPEFSTEKAISLKLNLADKIVTDALHFLERAGLVKRNSSRYEMTQRRIHLDKSSPLISRHHSNWRMKSAQQCEQPKSEDLRYSCIMGISESDAVRMRELLLELIAKSEVILKESKEEQVFIFLCDFLGL